MVSVSHNLEPNVAQNKSGRSLRKPRSQFLQITGGLTNHQQVPVVRDYRSESIVEQLEHREEAGMRILGK